MYYYSSLCGTYKCTAFATIFIARFSEKGNNILFLFFLKCDICFHISRFLSLYPPLFPYECFYKQYVAALSTAFKPFAIIVAATEDASNNPGSICAWDMYRVWNVNTLCCFDTRYVGGRGTILTQKGK